MRVGAARITRERLLALVDYDPISGVFTRRKDGKGIGFWESVQQRVMICLDGDDYVAARLAWLIAHGEWPSGRVTFKDGDRRNLAAANIVLERRRRLRDMPDGEAQQRLHELFDFDAERGLLIARVARRDVAPGEPCLGCDFSGYRMLCVDGKQFLVHRLIWLYVHGCWPTDNIDHRDGDGCNNRLANLRDVPQVVNSQNLRKARSNNRSTGMLGAYKRNDTGRFTSRIGVDGKSLSLGCFDSAEEAQSAYIEAKRRLHEGCTI